MGSGRDGKGEIFLKKVIGYIFSRSLLAGCSIEDIARDFYLSEKEAKTIIKEMQKKGLVKPGKRLELTDKARKMIKVVLTGGVFDIIHRGHIYTLSKAKELGDVLIVTVARDKIVKKIRGRPAINPEHHRAELVSSIKYVDAALLASEDDPLGALYYVKPDIVAIGYDQKHDEAEIERKAAEKGIKLVVKRLDSPFPNLKSTKIKKEKTAMHSL